MRLHLGSAITSLSLCTILALSSTPGCFYGYTSAAKNIASRRNGVAIVFGLATVLVGVGLGLALDDRKAENTPPASLALSTLGLVGGLGAIAAGLGGFAINAAVPVRDDSTNDDD